MAAPPPGAGEAEADGPDGAPDAPEQIVFHLTSRQVQRRRIGLAGGAIIVWSLGLVRVVVADRFSSGRGLLALVALAVVLAGAVVVLAWMAPVVVAVGDALHTRRGPWRATVPRAGITDIVRRDRGTAQRVVVHQRDGTTVLPVPLTGGSILGPGADPELDRKIALLRTWWRGTPASGPDRSDGDTTTL